MKSSEQYPLASLVHIDEFTLGGKEQGKQGRSYDSKKKKAVIAVELNSDKKIKRAYVKSIDDYSSKSLSKIFDAHISEHAKVITDKWRGYEPLKKTYEIEQKFSNNGTNFNELHIIIMQIKSWIRAIPTRVSQFHIQAYFDEFCCRINRSQAKYSIFHKAIERMVKYRPIFQKNIKQIPNV